MLSESSPASLQYRLRFRSSSKFIIDGLSVTFLQFRFIVEQIDLGRTAEHEQENHRFGFGWEHGTLALQHRKQRKGTKSCASSGAESTTIKPMVFGTHNGLIHVEKFATVKDGTAQADHPLGSVF
jgi:hypothetical protein